MRPIDANDTIKKIIALGEQLDQHDRAVILMVALYLNNVNDIPTIDTSGRRTAHWKHIAPSCWQCDCCGAVNVKPANYCMDCGCEMEKENIE